MRGPDRDPERLGDATIVARGLCSACGKVEVELTRNCVQLAKVFNRELVRRNEKPLSNDELARCPGCARLWKLDQLRYSAERLRTSREFFADMRSRKEWSRDEKESWLRTVESWLRDEHDAAIRSFLEPPGPKRKGGKGDRHDWHGGDR